MLSPSLNVVLAWWWPGRRAQTSSQPLLSQTSLPDTSTPALATPTPTSTTHGNVPVRPQQPAAALAHEAPQQDYGTTTAALAHEAPHQDYYSVVKQHQQQGTPGAVGAAGVGQVRARMQVAHVVHQIDSSELSAPVAAAENPKTAASAETDGDDAAAAASQASLASQASQQDMFPPTQPSDMVATLQQDDVPTDPSDMVATLQQDDVPTDADQDQDQDQDQRLATPTPTHAVDQGPLAALGRVLTSSGCDGGVTTTPTTAAAAAAAASVAGSAARPRPTPTSVWGGQHTHVRNPDGDSAVDPFHSQASLSPDPRHDSQSTQELGGALPTALPITAADGQVARGVFDSQYPALDLTLVEPQPSQPTSQHASQQSAVSPLKKTQEQEQEQEQEPTPATSFSPSKCGCIATACVHSTSAGAGVVPETPPRSLGQELAGTTTSAQKMGVASSPMASASPGATRAHVPSFVLAPATPTPQPQPRELELAAAATAEAQDPAGQHDETQPLEAPQLPLQDTPDDTPETAETTRHDDDGEGDCDSDDDNGNDDDDDDGNIDSGHGNNKAGAAALASPTHAPPAPVSQNAWGSAGRGPFQSPHAAPTSKGGSKVAPVPVAEPPSPMPTLQLVGETPDFDACPTEKGGTTTTPAPDAAADAAAAADRDTRAADGDKDSVVDDDEATQEFEKGKASPGKVDESKRRRSTAENVSAAAGAATSAVVEFSSAAPAGSKPGYRPVVRVTPTASDQVAPATTTAAAASSGGGGSSKQGQPGWIRAAKTSAGKKSTKVDSLISSTSTSNKTSEMHTENDGDDSDPFAIPKSHVGRNVAARSVSARTSTLDASTASLSSSEKSRLRGAVASAPNASAPRASGVQRVSSGKPAEGSASSPAAAAADGGQRNDASSAECFTADAGADGVEAELPGKHLTPAIASMEGGAQRKRLEMGASPAVPTKEATHEVPGEFRTPKLHAAPLSSSKGAASSSSRRARASSKGEYLTKSELKAPGWVWKQCVQRVQITKYFTHVTSMRETKVDGHVVKTEILDTSKVEASVSRMPPARSLSSASMPCCAVWFGWGSLFSCA